jgi:hypothetical protein
MLKAKKKTPSRLEELGQQLIAVQQAINALEEENERLFRTRQNLLDEKEGLIDKIKTDARHQSEEGTTKVLIESPDLLISVQGRVRPAEYPYNLVVEHWPVDIRRIVVVNFIDPKLVKKVIEQGKLTSDLALKAMVLGELPTPAVTVKLA